MIEAFIDCHPPTATAQHKSAVARDAGYKVGRRGKLIRKHKISFFETGDVKEAREQLTAHFRRHAPAQVMAGPLKFTCVWTFYWNKADEAKRKRGMLKHWAVSQTLRQWVPKITSPDGDNLAKMVKDVLQSLGYVANDAHISAETYIRGTGDRPGIHFKLEPYRAEEWYNPPDSDEEMVEL